MPLATVTMSMANSQKRAGSHFSKVVTGLQHSGKRETDTPSRRSTAETAAGLQSDEEEEEEISEDEEELLRNATPFYEEEDTESTLSQNILFEAQALGNFLAEEEGDLSFKEHEILTILESQRDDGWLLAQNALGERGLVPSNYVKQLSVLERPSHAVSPAEPSATPRRGRDLWSKLRHSVKQTSLADVLSALGAIPSGFRDSTMVKLLTDSPAYLTSRWVKPHPSSTAMSFKNLKWDHHGDHLKPLPTKISHEIVILMARKIPLPGKSVDVLSRHVRIAVFNKNDMLSNIHTVRATWSPQDEKTWKFVSKSQTATNSLYHQVCTVRVDSNDTNLELLFELGITFQKASGERGDISCGWSFLPLYNHYGTPTPSKTYELKVHGGTPFESGVDLEASSHSAVSGVKTTLQTRQMPRLYIRLVTPPKSRRANHLLLPPTIVTAATYNRVISCFRHSVGVSCLRGRLGLPLQNSIVKPSLNVFLTVIDQPDVMDSILTLLQERLKLAKRVEKNSIGYVSEVLEHVLLQHIYPLLNSPSFPPPFWADEAVEMDRVKFMESWIKRADLSALLAPDVTQNKLNIHEQIFCIYPQ